MIRQKLKKLLQKKLQKLSTVAIVEARTLKRKNIIITTVIYSVDWLQGKSLTILLQPDRDLCNLLPTTTTRS